MSFVKVAVGAATVGVISVVNGLIKQDSNKKAAKKKKKANEKAADIVDYAWKDTTEMKADAALAFGETTGKLAEDVAVIQTTGIENATAKEIETFDKTADIIGTAETTAGETKADAFTEAAEIIGTAETEAAETKVEYGDKAIEEQQRQFDALKEIFKPWVDQGVEAMGRLGQYEDAGSDALKRQRALLGLDGADAQRAAIEGISQSPEMIAMIGQGEDALRQQGAATGGLRGGNTQAALAQFRPSMLSQLINQQYSKLGGLIDMGQGITMNRAQLGQASTAQVGSAGMQAGTNIGNLLMGQGSALGQGILGAGNAYGQGTIGAGNARGQGILGAGNAYGQGAFGSGMAGASGIRELTDASVNGFMNSGLARAGGIYDAANIRAEGGLGAAKDKAGYIADTGTMEANQQIASGDIWSNILNQFIYGGIAGAAAKKW